MRRRARSGPDGLAGMSAVRELAACRVLRPLLGFAKARLAAVLAAERQAWITDPSNLDPAFERARLRLAGSAIAGSDGAVAPGQVGLGRGLALGGAEGGLEAERPEDDGDEVDHRCETCIGFS